MYKTIKPAEILTTANSGETVYMVVPISGSTTVDELNRAEAFVRIEPEGAKVERVVSQVVPETPETPKGMPKELQKAPIKKIDTGKLKALYRAGWEPKKIADELGCSLSTVYVYTKRIDNGEEI